LYDNTAVFKYYSVIEDHYKRIKITGGGIS